MESLPRIAWHSMWAVDELNVSLSPIWKGIGSSLHDVEIGAPYHDEYLDLPGLGRNCKNVTKLSFGWALDPDADLCAQYRPGLKQLDIGYNLFAAKYFRQICEACPDICILHGRVRAAGMIAMGPSASRLFVLNGREIESLPRTANACANIQSCMIKGDVSAASLRDMFVVPKPELKKLQIDVGDVNVFQVLAEEVSTLEDFVYSGPIPAIPRFAHFVVNNQSLKAATVAFQSDLVCSCIEVNSDAMDSCLDRSPIVKPILRCPNLEGVDFSCNSPTGKKRPKLADICVAVRGKGISLAISYYQYEGDMVGLSTCYRENEEEKRKRASRLWLKWTW